MESYVMDIRSLGKCFRVYIELTKKGLVLHIEIDFVIKHAVMHLSYDAFNYFANNDKPE